MKKERSSKHNAQKTDSPALTLQAGSDNLVRSPEKNIALLNAHPPHWARYVDSRLKQFCMR